MKQYNHASEIPVGTILSSSWNGMSNYYIVQKTSAKSLTVQEISYETCAGPEDCDPTHRWTHICYPFVYRGSSKRVMTKELPNGGIRFSLGWNKCDYVTVVAEPNNHGGYPSKTFEPVQMYWG